MTHEVANQPPPLAGYDAFAANPWLVAAARGLPVARPRARSASTWAARRRSSGALANRYTPELRTHDRYGHRIDRVEYHPSYHVLMRARSARACIRSRGSASAAASPRAPRSSTSGTSSSRAPRAR